LSAGWARLSQHGFTAARHEAAYGRRVYRAGYEIDFA